MHTGSSGVWDQAQNKRETERPANGFRRAKVSPQSTLFLCMKKQIPKSRTKRPPVFESIPGQPRTDVTEKTYGFVQHA